MTTSLARNPVTFLSGGRYSVACQHHLLCFSLGGATAHWAPRGGFEGGGGTTWTVVQGQVAPMLPLSSVLFLASPSLSWLHDPLHVPGLAAQL